MAGCPLTRPKASAADAARHVRQWAAQQLHRLLDLRTLHYAWHRGLVLRVVYGNGQRIVQAPGVVAVSYEMIHDTRLIYTDGRPHLNQAIRQYLGDSRAHWEGDELVVETTNLTDRTAIGLNGNGNRHSSR